MEKNLKELEGKTIKVFLITGRIYTGKVLEVESRSSLSFITILDKFNCKVGFASTEIKRYEELQ